MKKIQYNRNAAYEYAKKWAYSRNPKYYNFDNVGGDCTNFISQCIYEGTKIMNYKTDLGWYYINGNNKSPSWSSVEYLYNFLTQNKSTGPYGKEIKIEDTEIGDLVQLSFDGKKYSHTVIITKKESSINLNQILVASHTFDAFNKSLTEYTFLKLRFIKILGAQK